MITAQQIINTWQIKYDSSTGHEPNTLMANLNLVMRDAFYKICNSDSRFFSTTATLVFNGSPVDLPDDFRTTAFIGGGLYDQNDVKIGYEIKAGGVISTNNNTTGSLTLKYLPNYIDVENPEDDTIFDEAFLNALVFGLDREIHDTERNPIMEQNADAKFQRQLHMALKATRKTSNVIKMSR